MSRFNFPASRLAAARGFIAQRIGQWPTSIGAGKTECGEWCFDVGLARELADHVEAPATFDGAPIRYRLSGYVQRLPSKITSASR